MLKYHIITIGCQMNKSDSERIASKLESSGYNWSDNKYQADLVVVNTCGVRQSAENRIYGLIPEIKRNNIKVKIILTGCLVNRKDVKRRLEKYVDEWLPISKIFNFQFSIFNKFSNSNFQTNTKCSDYLEIKPKYESKFLAYVPIGNGCNNFCTYCVVPYARGREKYRSVTNIIKEVKNLISQDYKEIMLLAQNVNSYKSKKVDFADLLKKINDIKGDFWITFMTSHPKDVSNKLIKIIAESEKVKKEIHLPVQSGDNEILKKMNRGYTREYYLKLIKKIKAQIPEVKISTDIIVGFPSETKKQFKNTVDLVKEVGFSKIYASKYSPRPGTVAFKLEDNVLKEEKERRWQVLEKILKIKKPI